jgi:hypothetical protein
MYIGKGYCDQTANGQNGSSAYRSVFLKQAIDIASSVCQDGNLTLLCAAYFWRIFMNEVELIQRVMELERKVDFLMQELSLTEKYQYSQPADPVMEDIQMLVRRGNLIQAIKLYRERTGVGLAEAKAAVERMKGY